MCRLLLVRHGQACFGERNYDQLSELGIKQAQLLGEYFYHSKLNCVFIGHGSLQRQRHTAEIVASELDEPVKLRQFDWLNELDSQSLLKHYAHLVELLPPELLRPDRHTDGDELLSQSSVSKTEKGLGLTSQNEELTFCMKKENFAQVFYQLLSHWANDKDCPFESFTAFQQRIIDGLVSLSHEYSTEDTLILTTSGGVIATIIQQTLQLSFEKMIETAVGLYNASVTEVFIDEKNWQLVESNSITALKLNSEIGLLSQL